MPAPIKVSDFELLGPPLIPILPMPSNTRDVKSLELYLNIFQDERFPLNV